MRKTMGKKKMKFYAEIFCSSKLVLYIDFIFRGVPFPIVCRNRGERIAAIGDAISRSDYHIVALQEVSFEKWILHAQV